jgi:hypothetical protein
MGSIADLPILNGRNFIVEEHRKAMPLLSKSYKLLNLIKVSTIIHAIKIETNELN